MKHFFIFAFLVLLLASCGERYFFVTYHWEDAFRHSNGNCFWKQETIPSHSQIKDSIASWNKFDTTHGNAIIIQNIIEFKNKADYLNFLK